MSDPMTGRLHYGIDTPRPLQPTQNYFQLIGWAFVAGDAAVTSIRVVVGEKTFEPVERIERPDVARQFPDEPAAAGSGFKFIGYLPFGFYAGELQAWVEGIPNAECGVPNAEPSTRAAADMACAKPGTRNLEPGTTAQRPGGPALPSCGAWVRVCSFAIPVSSHPILGAIDFPPPAEVITEPVRIQGWCFHPEFRVTQVVLQFGNVEVPCEYGCERHDVAGRFPEFAQAARSGFITTENLPRGRGAVKIRVRTECGRVYFVSSAHRVQIERGWIPNPPPPSPVRDLSTAAWKRPKTQFAPAAAHPNAPTNQRQQAGGQQLAANEGGTAPRGERNILLALYGDFSANSALHVASFANELIARGYDCVVAVPDHKETLGALPQARFMAVQFDELDELPAYFRDGRGPALVHAWTSRENVRRFTGEVVRRHGSAVFVHLEDNEQEILETRLGRPFAELARLTTAELDDLVPVELSHPHRAADFLRTAAGVTVIVDRLREHVPPGVPTAVIWPGADARHFTARPRDDRLRAALGIAPTDIVVFYHGNTHASNAAEVRSLYEAVARLNERGRRTLLIRTGRDIPEFVEATAAWIRPHLIHLGFVGRAKHLPPLMALADYFVQPGAADAFNDYRFPSKLPEFFSVGRPVVLPRTNLGAVVRHREDAWVLPRADAAAIADAIAALQDDPELRARLAAGALGFAAAHFSWPRSTEQLVSFYRSLTPLAPAASS
jgi:glycosyltransferase involved in cell wall biosynthesis